MTKDTPVGPDLPIPRLIQEVPQDPHEVRDWYFTFGAGHFDQETGTPLATRYVKINGTYKAARQRMILQFGAHWAFQYESAEHAGVGPFELVEWPLTRLADRVREAMRLIYQDGHGDCAARIARAIEGRQQ